MLKTVSSVANALGALNYKGTWNASTNTPTLASGVGTQGDYYVVSVAGATDLDGITNWGVGDWAAFNGSVWQRVEGGADGNFVNLDVTNNANIGNDVGIGTTVPDQKLEIKETSTGAGDAIIRLRGSGDNADNTPLGSVEWYNADTTGDQPGVVAAVEAQSDSSLGNKGKLIFKTHDGSEGGAGSAPVERMRIDSDGNVALALGNLVISTSGKGIDFSATAGTGTSELFDDYEEGVWTPTYAPQTGSFTSITYNSQLGKYTKVGDTVYAFFDLNVVVDPTGASGTVSIGGLPFFGLQTACFGGIGAARRFATSFTFGGLQTSGTAILPYKTDTSNLNLVPLDVTDLATGGFRNLITAGVTYKVS